MLRVNCLAALKSVPDPAARTLMTRIDAAPIPFHPDPSHAVAGHYLTRLEVDLRDGR